MCHIVSQKNNEDPQIPKWSWAFSEYKWERLQKSASDGKSLWLSGRKKSSLLYSDLQEPRHRQSALDSVNIQSHPGSTGKVWEQGIAGKGESDQGPFHFTQAIRVKNQAGLGSSSLHFDPGYATLRFLETEQPDFGKFEATELLEEIALEEARGYPWMQWTSSWRKEIRTEGDIRAEGVEHGSAEVVGLLRGHAPSVGRWTGCTGQQIKNSQGRGWRGRAQPWGSLIRLDTTGSTSGGNEKFSLFPYLSLSASISVSLCLSPNPHSLFPLSLLPCAFLLKPLPSRKILLNKLQLGLNCWWEREKDLWTAREDNSLQEEKPSHRMSSKALSQLGASRR